MKTKFFQIILIFLIFKSVNSFGQGGKKPVCDHDVYADRYNSDARRNLTLDSACNDINKGRFVSGYNHLCTVAEMDSISTGEPDALVDQQRRKIKNYIDNNPEDVAAAAAASEKTEPEQKNAAGSNKTAKEQPKNTESDEKKLKEQEKKEQEKLAEKEAKEKQEQDKIAEQGKKEQEKLAEKEAKEKQEQDKIAEKEKKDQERIADKEAKEKQEQEKIAEKEKKEQEKLAQKEAKENKEKPAKTKKEKKSKSDVAENEKPAENSGTTTSAEQENKEIVNTENTTPPETKTSEEPIAKSEEPEKTKVEEDFDAPVPPVDLKFSEAEVAQFQEKGLQKIKLLEGYIKQVGSKTTSSSLAMDATENAILLFDSEGRMVEVSNLTSKVVAKYKVRKYLDRLRFLNFDDVDITWADFQYTSDFIKGPDGNYHGYIIFRQRFTATKDNQVVYEDVTTKKVEVILKFYSKAVAGVETENWDVLLGDISVEQTEKK